MIHCFHCDNNVSDDMTFCTNCGQKLVVYGNDFVIPNVGLKSDGEEFETVIRPPVTGTAASFELEDSPKDRTVGKIAAAIAGLFVFGGLLYFVGKRSAEPVQIPVPVEKIITITATPIPQTKTPEPTPQIVKAERPKPTPISVDEMRDRYDRIDPPIAANRPTANANAIRRRPPANNFPMTYPPFQNGNPLRAICNNGEPSYFPLDQWLVCMGAGGVKVWIKKDR